MAKRGFFLYLKCFLLYPQVPLLVIFISLSTKVGKVIKKKVIVCCFITEICTSKVFMFSKYNLCLFLLSSRNDVFLYNGVVQLNFSLWFLLFKFVVILHSCLFSLSSSSSRYEFNVSFFWITGSGEPLKIHRGPWLPQDFLIYFRNIFF